MINNVNFYYFVRVYMWSRTADWLQSSASWLIVRSHDTRMHEMNLHRVSKILCKIIFVRTSSNFHQLWKYGTSAFNVDVTWIRWSEKWVHLTINFSLFAVCATNFHSWWKFDKILTKQFCTVFLRHGVSHKISQLSQHCWFRLPHVCINECE